MNFLNHTKQSLVDLISQSIYDNNGENCKIEIAAILLAAQLGDITNHKIHLIDFSKDSPYELLVWTHWGIPGSKNRSKYAIPISIIHSDDPIKAATEWGWGNKIDKMEQKLQHTKNEVEEYEHQLATFRFHFNEFKRTEV